MRFCDFFLEYKYAVKQVKSTIPITKLPFQQKVLILIDFLMCIGLLITYLFKLYTITAILVAIFLSSVIIFLLLDSRKNNIRKMLDDNYLPYSEQRMNAFFSVLEKYKINLMDKDTLKLLIEQAQSAKIKSNPFIPYRNAFKVLGAVIVPIIAFVAQKIAETTSNAELLTFAIVFLIITICTFSVILAVVPILNDLFNRNTKYYDELIDDLNQTIIFYK